MASPVETQNSVMTSTEKNIMFNFRSSQGVAKYGQMDGTAALPQPLLTPDGGMSQLGVRRAIFTTAFDYFYDWVGDPSYYLKNNKNADAAVLMHPVVAACLRRLSYRVATQEDSFIPCPYKKFRSMSKKAADYVAGVWHNIPNIIHLYDLLMKSLIVGGIGIEFIWEKTNEDAWIPRSFWPVDKDQFVRNTQGYMFLKTRENFPWGALVGYNPITLPDGKEKLTPLFPGKFLYHCHRYDTGPFYRSEEWGFMYWGRGEADVLYPIVAMDTDVLKLRLKLIDKFAVPPGVLYYPDQQTAVRQFQSILTSLKGADSVIRLPRTAGQPIDSQYDIKFLDKQMGSYDMLDNYFQNYTVPNIRAVMLADTEQYRAADKGGHSAAVEDAENSSEVVVAFCCANIANTINHQLLPYIVWANPDFKDLPLAAMPRLLKAPERTRRKMNELNLLKDASTCVPIQAQDFYRAIGREVPTDAGEFMGKSIYNPENELHDDSQDYDPKHTPYEDVKPRNEKRETRDTVNDPATLKEKSRKRRGSQFGVEMDAVLERQATGAAEAAVEMFAKRYRRE